MSHEFTALFLGLSLYIAAFLAEIVRSGLQAVSHGQVDAGKSLGLARGQIYRLVLIPQALRIIIPPTAAQYVSLAKNSALAMQPQILLFDEPTSALDPEMVKEVLDVMLDLAGDGRTMLCVTHEMGFARAMADRIIFMDGGEIVEALPPDEFFDAPSSERTRLFLSQILNH
jgi:ABC-type arginine transport system ATPase subunit